MNPAKPGVKNSSSFLQAADAFTDRDSIEFLISAQSIILKEIFLLVISHGAISFSYEVKFASNAHLFYCRS